MSDTALHLLLAAAAVLVAAEQAALVAIGYLAARKALREAVAENRDLRERLVAAEAIIRAAEAAGYLQTTTSGRH
ncbi:hypothetical protein, partial [Nocardiopsis composta]